MKFQWRNREQRLKDELQDHLRMAARDRIERGQAPEQADRAARREFGNVSLVGEVTRDQCARAGSTKLRKTCAMPRACCAKILASRWSRF